ncbi:MULTISPECIES: ChaN family lipoprotein [unclassified Photobacterium]|uniref:ChaN family lipoprotein n=1 Tax=unclassified Photobacterium TaxID=2628852 RepID=UPI001EDE455F|nr:MULTISPECIES: ChaN family lipoprotein [unclassified Photobacterium]MCG3863222.1 ChaN family lipoprotein [Photobacterium sp. Ph6]MCG3874752.1 ChaN family lipoprotein [Photobacterium sp. Ph5]
MNKWLALSFSFATLLTGCASNTSQTTAFSSANLTTLYDYSITSPIGKTLTVNQLATELKNTDIILVGEWHSHPAAHLLQSQLFAALYQQNSQLTLSMEQFTRDKQAIVDQYLAGEIGERTLVAEGNAWPNYDSDYRPLVEFAKQNKLDVIAANAPKSIVRCISKKGPEYLKKLPSSERSWVAQSLTLDKDAYQTKFLSSMHHGNEEQNLRMFAAQTAWDDTMAESMVTYLDAHPNKQIIHVAGRFHTMEGLGTASRIKARNPNLKVALVTPITTSEVLSNNALDYKVTMAPLPVRYVQKEKQKKAMMDMMKRNKDLKCYE